MSISFVGLERVKDEGCVLQQFYCIGLRERNSRTIIRVLATPPQAAQSFQQDSTAPRGPGLLTCEPTDDLVVCRVLPPMRESHSLFCHQTTNRAVGGIVCPADAAAKV